METFWSRKMTFKELALKMLKEFPDGIWVHFHNMPDGFIMDCETYLDADSLDDFEGRLKQEVTDYYVDDFAYEELVVHFERGLKNERKNVNFHGNGYFRMQFILD